MSNIKEVHGKQRLHVSVNLWFGVWPSRRRRAYAPTRNAANHDNHEKINSWVSFSFSYEYGAPHGDPLGRRSSAMKLEKNCTIKLTILSDFCLKKNKKHHIPKLLFYYYFQKFHLCRHNGKQFLRPNYFILQPKKQSLLHFVFIPRERSEWAQCYSRDREKGIEL